MAGKQAPVFVVRFWWFLPVSSYEDILITALVHLLYSMRFFAALPPELRLCHNTIIQFIMIYYDKVLFYFDFLKKL